MSHVSKHKSKVKEINVLKAILADKGIEYRENCKVNLYGSNKIDAMLAFKLPGWQYECAVNKDGEIQYDHFGSQSSTFGKLGEIIQDYNVAAIMEKAWLTAANVWQESHKSGVKKVILEF